MEQSHQDHDSKPQQPRLFLLLYSHARRPPLSPAPDLKYDLRGIPNPPKALRDGSDGRSKRLRNHLLAEPKFVQTLEAVESDVRQAMQQKIEEWEAATYQQESEAPDSLTDSNSSLGRQEKDESTALGIEPEHDNRISNEGTQTRPENHKVKNAIVLRVGCYCALGHHRSVAFVHELAQLPWRAEWTVEVQHRDLGERRSGGTRERQKATFRRRGGEEASGWDMD